MKKSLQCEYRVSDAAVLRSALEKETNVVRRKRAKG